jgi:hypothetical protein
MPFGGLLTVGAISAGSSIFGGLFGASKSKQAAQQYEQALTGAQNYLQGEENTGLQNYQPYMSAGSQATNTLSSLMGTPGQGLLQNWDQQFTAPTAAQAAATPGYQFQLQQGLGAAQNSAAGQGGLLSGRTLADLNNYAQGTASTNYQNTFNNSLTQYQSAYNTFLNNQQNQYNRLMGVSQEGLQATGGADQFMQGMSGDVASLMAQKGAVAAGGTISAANDISGMVSGLGNTATQMYGLSQLNGDASNTNGLFTDQGLNVMQPSYMQPPAPTSPYSATNLPPGSLPSMPGFLTQ